MFKKKPVLVRVYPRIPITVFIQQGMKMKITVHRFYSFVSSMGYRYISYLSQKTIINKNLFEKQVKRDTKSPTDVSVGVQFGNCHNDV